MNIEVLWDGFYGLSSLSEKTRKSNHLQIKSGAEFFTISFVHNIQQLIYNWKFPHAVSYADMSVFVVKLAQILMLNLWNEKDISINKILKTRNWKKALFELLYLKLLVLMLFWIPEVQFLPPSSFLLSLWDYYWYFTTEGLHLQPPQLYIVIKDSLGQVHQLVVFQVPNNK